MDEENEAVEGMDEGQVDEEHDTEIPETALTLTDIELIKKALGDAPLGIKASAGIRDEAKARALVEVGATRLGTSAGVDIVSGKAKQNEAQTQKAAY